MDFKNLNADKNLILNKHFSAGRSGRKVEFIVPHYAAGDLSLEGYYSVWQSRQASAHYAVDSNGKCAQLVWDRDTSWSCGNWDANCKSISIEHSNRGDVITDACRETGAHLVAALCIEFKLGRPEWGKNVRMHRDFAATNCPGPLATTYKDSYIKRAQEWYDAMTAGGSAPAPSPAPTPSPAPSPAPQPNSSEHVGTGFGGVYTCMAPSLNVRTAPTVNSGTVASYSKGMTVTLDDWYKIADGYVWGRYTGGSGNKRYVAVGKATGKVDANDYLIKNGGAGGGSAPKPQAPNIDQMARDVIAGKYGSGDARKRALGANYDAVQKRVNEILGGGAPSRPAQNLDAVARAVIRGDYGNGPDRARRLRAAGYDPDAVQRRVNQLL